MQLQEIKWQLPFYLVFTLSQKQDSIGDLMTSDYVQRGHVKKFLWNNAHNYTDNAFLVAHAHS